MEKENLNQLKEIITKEHLRKIKEKDMEFLLNNQLMKNMKDIGQMINLMEKEN